jgi:hypothetical protein
MNVIILIVKEHSLRETMVQEGITIKGKSLREHFETHNHDKQLIISPL